MNGWRVLLHSISGKYLFFPIMFVPFLFGGCVWNVRYYIQGEIIPFDSTAQYAFDVRRANGLRLENQLKTENIKDAKFTLEFFLIGSGPEIPKEIDLSEDGHFHSRAEFLGTLGNLKLMSDSSLICPMNRSNTKARGRSYITYSCDSARFVKKSK